MQYREPAGILLSNPVMEARMFKPFKHVDAEEVIRIMIEFGIVVYAAMIVLKVINSYSLL